MGLFRKTLSLSTFGAVDFRSDKERAARYGKQGRNELRKQTELLESRAAPGDAHIGNGWNRVPAPPYVLLQSPPPAHRARWSVVVLEDLGPYSDQVREAVFDATGIDAAGPRALGWAPDDVAVALQALVNERGGRL